MGSLSGRSKAPVASVQQQIAATTTTSSPSISEVTQPTEQDTLVERAEGLLKRSRSRLGTVLTGFQGILSQNDLVAPRKTLLGE